MTRMVTFLDVEVGGYQSVEPQSDAPVRAGRVCDVAALRSDGSFLHTPSSAEAYAFIEQGIKMSAYLCGHNIVHHDARFLPLPSQAILIDTLYMSPILFPKRPYHRLVKDEKLQGDELNNPLNDCRKTQDLFYEEVAAWNSLEASRRKVYASLLSGVVEFAGFLDYVSGWQHAEADEASQLEVATPDVANVEQVVASVRSAWRGLVCENADIAHLVVHHRCELAYALAIISTTDSQSVTPPWVLYRFPKVLDVLRVLCNTPCSERCRYCDWRLDAHNGLKRFFGFDKFRLFDGEPLQQSAVESALSGESLLAIFPTGGGKSLTFQLPALMAGETVHGLTVVISPLQSLMKDQVDNLAERGVASAVTVNGLLDPISRADAIARVEDGSATILYISPEMLRSRTIAHLLERRNVVRFVIDEAHCFSAWGQDFRVDYLYIGQFIAMLQERKQLERPIAVSCFTATAKQKVVSDICDYFQRTLGLRLRIFTSSSSRTNLHYSVIHVESEEEKYTHLRSLIASGECPTIVYVGRTRRSIELAQRLTRDGFKALPFNGKMDSDQKVANQNAFMGGAVQTIVATSAFGMGVDKKDVGLVVHYDISDSLENYVQEAGRAGRDPQMQARCYVLYGDQDLDKHFVLLNQTKLSMSEIQQVWKAVRELTRVRPRTTCSALEIARQAGWNDGVSDIETRVRTAIATLEQAGYVERGNNVPHVYATGIMVKNMEEARQRLTQSALFDDADRQHAVRIIKSLISSRQVARAQDSETESRIDYLADILGIAKETVISIVQCMRQDGILADSRDIAAYLQDADNQKNRSLRTLEHYVRLEQFLYTVVSDEGVQMSLRQLNEQAEQERIPGTSVKNIRTLLFFLSAKEYLCKVRVADQNIVTLTLAIDRVAALHRFDVRIRLSRFLLSRLYEMAESRPAEEASKPITFSVVAMLKQYQQQLRSSLFSAEAEQVTLADVEEALLYLSKIGSLRLEGGFLVLYNAMEINRIKDSKCRYKVEDYRLLNEFYKQKIQQVHIVGEYANLMVRDYHAALQYVQDYFQMDHKHFVAKYFKGERAADLQLNITPAKYRQLFGQLSQRQRDIISDKDSRCIVVVAGPGSGKTRVLVHKMASLLLLEEVKHEQLLMLTFSRAAATEFKQRLIDLIGNAAHFVEIKTFHSYCFDLLGRVGNLDDAKDVVQRAADMIAQGEVEPTRISKAVLVIDEAQDMDVHEYALLCALMRHNEDMRVIAVGDDDQNVYQFRGSDSRFMRQLVGEMGARRYELSDNYRSSKAVVRVANNFASLITGRMKQSPIVAVRPEEGCVEVVRHTDCHMEIPLVRHLVQRRPAGTTCVLTNTNDEALRITALLRQHKVRCRLIQSMDGFRLLDLAEVRYFLRFIRTRLTSPVIGDDLWQHAKEKLIYAYSRSVCLDNMKRLIAEYEKTNRTKYFSDFYEFLFESSIEDFASYEGSEVVVSTIHKAKGREFDNVFLYVSNNHDVTSDYLRQLYVGLTRAKQNLYVHCCENLFDNLNTSSYTVDQSRYPMPATITLKMTHRDVFLDFFRKCKGAVLALRSGDSLQYSDGTLMSVDGVPVAQISTKLREELAQWNAKGYVVQSAEVRYIVAWRPKDAPTDQPEVAVLLADLHLQSVSCEL